MNDTVSPIEISDNDKRTRPPVTEKLLTIQPVTERLASGDRTPGAVTERLRTTATEAPAFQLTPGTMIADRYRIESKPLGSIAGHAQVYLCRDEQLDEPVVVKLYAATAAAKPDILAQLRGLSHPSIVQLRDHGPWAGWSFEVMEFCAGGPLAEIVPFAEDELRRVLPAIANGLNYLHDCGIIHRDVKPSNLLFRDAERREVVIADFDISSILEIDAEAVRKTQTADNLTIDYAAPELLEDKEVSAKTDYYALGITLIHLLTGRSPFEGRRYTEVAIAHLRGRVPMPDTVSPAFMDLLRGLLQIAPTNRWGYAQVTSWLEGRPILNDNGLPWKADLFGGRSQPYPGFPEAKTPRELAACLGRFDADKQLFKTGDIRRWVFDYFDADLARRIEEIEENYTHNRPLGLVKLKYLLDPALPLEIGGSGARSIHDLADLLGRNDEATNHRLATALFDQTIECWIDSTGVVEHGGVLVGKIRAIRERLGTGKRRLALFALLHTLDPSRPVVLTSGLSFSHPMEVEQALTAATATQLAKFENFVYSGALEEWLLAAEFSSWKADGAFIEDCRRRFADDRALGCQAVRWRFRPELPFHFGRANATEPRQLAELIDHDAAATRLGIELLRKGWIRAWLTATGRLPDPRPYDAVIDDPATNWECKMEAILHLLNPALASPRVEAEPPMLRIGRVSLETTRSTRVTIKNSGRGYLFGAIALDDNATGLSLDQQKIDGGPVDIAITIDPRGLIVGSHQRTEIRVNSNGGQLTIPVYYEIAAPIAQMLGRSVASGLIVGLILGVYRLLVQAAWNADGHRFTNWISLDRTFDIVFHSGLTDGAFGIAGLGLLLIAALIGSAYFLYRMGKRRD